MRMRMHARTHLPFTTEHNSHARAWSCAGDELASLRAQLAEQATELERLRKRNAARSRARQDYLQRE
jgi:hypothetical protein